MGKIRVFPGGTSVSYPSVQKHARAKRGKVNGWTEDASRRLTQFLWSVEVDKLGSVQGWAVTLTMGGTPETSTLWSEARDRLLRWLRSTGSTRYQWLTEWTAAGRPHLHLCVFNDGFEAHDLALAWIRICRAAGWPAEWKAQTVEELHNATGWLKYVAKHSSRGVDHYQRESPPEGWETTGRLWGYGGVWPTADPFVMTLTSGQTFEYMTEFRLWQLYRMRVEGAPEGAISAYEAKLITPTIGGVPRGLSGWIPWADSVKLLLAVTETADKTGDSRK